MLRGAESTATKFTIDSLDDSKSPAGSALAATLDKLTGCRRADLMAQAQTQDDPRRNGSKDELMTN